MDFSSAENPVLLPGPNAFARGPWRAKAWGFLVHDFGVPQQIYGFTMVYHGLLQLIWFFVKVSSVMGVPPKIIPRGPSA